MPPNLDIYALTTSRDTATLNRFIEEYVDRAASEDRGDEELMMVPLPLKSGEEPDDWDWEPAQTLTHSIQRGLDYPLRAFTIYMRPKQQGLIGALIAFTTDDLLVLGLSIDYEGAHEEDEERAKALLHYLMEHYHCFLGLMIIDTPPPWSQAEFRQMVDKPYTVFVESFGEE